MVRDEKVLTAVRGELTEHIKKNKFQRPYQNDLEMQKIKWPLYTSDEFQTFCNSLLSFEISKKILPFSAPGRDGGTDGSYNGTYQEYTGK